MTEKGVRSRVTMESRMVNWPGLYVYNDKREISREGLKAV